MRAIPRMDSVAGGQTKVASPKAIVAEISWLKAMSKASRAKASPALLRAGVSWL